MRKLIRIAALSLTFCLLLSAAAFAEPKWVSSYRKTIRENFKPSTWSYYGLYDIGPDGSPELLLGSRTGGYTKIYVYYITKSGYVRRSSKYANVGKIESDYCMAVYDTGDGEVVVLEGESAGSGSGWSRRVYEISQTARKIVRVKDMFRIDSSSSGSNKYYYRGKKYSYAKYRKYYDGYLDTLDGYVQIEENYPAEFDSVSEAIDRFEEDAGKYW